MPEKQSFATAEAGPPGSNAPQKPADACRAGTPSVTIRAVDLCELLAEQEHRCALTGRPLTPATAAVDHKDPPAAGGSHCLSNLQILDCRVNLAKGGLTQDEFKAICREVVAYEQEQARR
jgi:hypothetical protein